MAIFVTLGILAGIFNTVRMVFLLIAYGRWTDGSYHQPALAAIQLLGAAVCLTMAVLALRGTFQHRVGLLDSASARSFLSQEYRAPRCSGSTWRRST